MTEIAAHKPFRRLRTTAIVLTIAVVLFTACNFWMFRPTLVSQEFVRLIMTRQMSEAIAMVSRPSEIAITDEQLSVKALDGSDWLVPVSTPRFFVLDEPSRPSRGRIVDYLLGRQQFQLCVTWRDATSDSDFIVPIYFTAYGSKIEIDHVGPK